MYGLMGWLLAKGEIAFMNTTYDTPFIGIYPEIAHGNPLAADKVVRYVLNKPGVMASYGVPGPTTYDKTDEIYVFSKIYDTFGVDENHLMFLPIINVNLFKNYHQKRTRTAYYVGKGRDLKRQPENSILIDASVTQNQSNLADLLNTCTVLYSYENPTALNEIARLCGCPVIFIEEGASLQYSREELDAKYEPGQYGIFYDEDTFMFSSDTFREHYLNLRTVFEAKLDLFIENTQR